MRRALQSIALSIAVFAAMAPTTRAAAQQGPALIRQGIEAYNNFDPQRALPLLRRGVDLKAGPRDSLWALGVQYLVQILYERADQAGARTWIRWAVRLTPDFKLDTLNLLSQVIAEFRSARATTTAGPDDARVVTEWVWPPTDPGAGQGRLELLPNGTPASLTVTVNGGPFDTRLSLPAGSYAIEARAPGYLPARITREVLPGITTLLVFSLQREPLIAVAPPLPAPGQRPVPAPPVAQKKKGHFPWAIVALGAVAGGAAVLLGGKGGGGGGQPSTGTIGVRFPNPP